MPIRYMIYNDYSCIIKVWLGVVTLEEWYAVERQIMEAPNLPRKFKLLTDVRKVDDVKITVEENKDMASFYDDYITKVSGAQVAVLAGAVFDRARRFENYAQSLGMNVIVFTNFDTACMWLNLDRKMVSEWIEQLRG